MGREKLPRMLWVRRGATSELDERMSLVQRHVEVVVCSDASRLARDVRGLDPRLICFEYESPSQRDLRAMHRLKLAHASLPILMLTVAHSEELAVWAFRARVWNYLVRPVDPLELERNIRALAALVSRPGAGRVPLMVNDGDQPPEAKAVWGSPTHRALGGVIRRIDSAFSERLRETDLARECGLSVFAFSRLFHRQVGMPFRQYLLQRRIDAAKNLLSEFGASPTKAALAAGFNDPSYFARQFRRATGLTPSAFARQVAQDRSTSSGTGFSLDAPHRDPNRRLT